MPVDSLLYLFWGVSLTFVTVLLTCRLKYSLACVLIAVLFESQSGSVLNLLIILSGFVLCMGTLKILPGFRWLQIGSSGMKKRAKVGSI